jgi:peptidoglycan-associated lipoprotein
MAAATLTLVAAGCGKKPQVAQTKTVVPDQTPAPRAQVQAPVRQADNTPAARPVSPKPDYPDAATRRRIDELLARIEDAYFDYDKHSLRPDAIRTMEANAKELRDILKDYPKFKLTIQGHCDERGSSEYNMVLGQARADAAKGYLVQVGIPSDQLGVVSYGKEKPSCEQSNEGCWQKNRRVHIVAASQP